MIAQKHREIFVNILHIFVNILEILPKTIHIIFTKL